MLSQQYRLSRKLFSEVLVKGKSIHSPHFSIVFLYTSTKSTRFSASVPKKVEKTAVKRNSIRRRMYERIQKSTPTFPGGIHAIMFAKAGAYSLSPQEYDREISLLLQKVLQ